MNTLINKLRNVNYTENDALTNKSSNSSVLDMFSKAGASRTLPEKDITTLWKNAVNEDIELATKCLFWSRDCRGGAGEKRFFQIIMKEIQKSYPLIFNRVYHFIIKYGYCKDFFKLEPTQDIVNFINIYLRSGDYSNLMAKYVPRKGKWFNALRKNLNMSPSEFRHFIVNKTNVVETKMCNNEWEKIQYEHVPSIASNIYRNVFYKHDTLRYQQYIQDVLSGKKKMNASVVFPSDLYRTYCMNHSNDSTINDSILAQWNALPDYLEGSEMQRIIPVCDTSGSMIINNCLPLSVSIGLGNYIAERNKGVFKDAFITFSDNPQMQYLTGNIIERFKQIETSKWGMSTNLQAVFDLILSTAIKNQIDEDEMPQKILIISDMEFNQATSKNTETNFEEIQRKYILAGYQMPQVVFWNVAAHSINNSPVTTDDTNVALVSGFSPAILTNILKGEIKSPYEFMLEVLNSERYSCITI